MTIINLFYVFAGMAIGGLFALFWVAKQQRKYVRHLLNRQDGQKEGNGGLACSTMARKTFSPRASTPSIGTKEAML